MTGAWAAAIGLTAAIAGVAGPACGAVREPVLAAARIERRGATLEVHFRFDAVSPRLRLSAHGNQLWVDLDHARIALPPRPLFGLETAPIASVRTVQTGGTGGQARIIVEVTGRADYAVGRRGREIILRVAESGTDPNIAAPIMVRDQSQLPGRRATAGVEPTIPEYRANDGARAGARGIHASMETPDRGIEEPLVMIDPGHGGYDPGTRSTSGILEKDLALKISLRLKAALEADGIRAELTRSGDEFIKLPDRIKIANRASANLFVSIHLNSSPNPDTTGIEVYYLNNTTDDHSTIRLARIENGGAGGYGTPDASTLNYILTDLRQNYKASEAVSLAKMIDAEAVAELDAGLGINVNPLGAKMGPFYVLVGAAMPAVLVECGFLSNAGEASRIESARYQDLLAHGIATAVSHYFNADLAVGNL